MKWLLIALIRFYQIVISKPLHFICGPFAGCRFEPSCSEYGLQAVRYHGAIRGGWLALVRICRCNPWGGCGWDPVPGVPEVDNGQSRSPVSTSKSCDHCGD
ncbi:membrane protein insertion efficiency factor YidD [Sulfuriroseicoccus oceanibius]|uniref:Putative membrane protein insertion efficiency factor n=1 Tax=Sulfuriroseicoccus oceanibius TaxID=2707525 RepID=A0A6B3L250_9BACT|nr:membrane protein insertion efficiency factor YidD [Sulfuriroseicoccus oceanibius]QQL44196.1 membrane protein insertion efficiency factor YidD [Sulfuriroseicoccus oceanibius]